MRGNNINQIPFLAAAALLTVNLPMTTGLQCNLFVCFCRSLSVQASRGSVSSATRLAQTIQAFISMATGPLPDVARRSISAISLLIRLVLSKASVVAKRFTT